MINNTFSIAFISNDGTNIVGTPEPRG